jgi:GNAT superfamily N-acetyltransferase
MAMIEVRSADDGDVETMAAIYVNAAREGWAHIFGESGLVALQPPVDRLRAELASTDPRRQVLVAEREGRVIGFAVVQPSRDGDADGIQVGELDQFYSDPVVWGQGVGRELMAAAIETLRENGFTEATLWVAEENNRPRQIYEVAGWTLDGVTRDKLWRGARVQDLRYRIKL